MADGVDPAALGVAEAPETGGGVAADPNQPAPLDPRRDVISSERYAFTSPNVTFERNRRAGVETETVPAGDARLRDVPKPMDRLAALALANSGGAVLVRVPTAAAVDLRPRRA
jgi:hypothetical protein